MARKTKAITPAPYVRTPSEAAAIERVRNRDVSNIRLDIKKDGSAKTSLGVDHKDLSTGALVLMDALGISRAEFAYEIAEQICNVATKGQELKEAPVNAMLAAIVGMKPRDEAEAMLCAQMVATHNLAMTFVRRLNHVDNIAQQDSATNALTKLTRTYAAQMAALKQYRTGGEQRVIVQRVDVREGGQAVVGVVNSARPDPVGGGASPKNGDQPHALTDARSSSMLCDVQKEPDPVPRAGRDGPINMQNARRNKPGRSARQS